MIEVFTSAAVFSQGFRPFFLLAGIWAIAALALSFGMFQGWIALPTASSTAVRTAKHAAESYPNRPRVCWIPRCSRSTASRQPPMMMNRCTA